MVRQLRMWLKFLNHIKIVRYDVEQVMVAIEMGSGARGCIYSS